MKAYCVFIDTLAEGSVPSVRNELNQPYLFETKHDAEREIAENAMTRLKEFLDGERDFEDATTIEEYVTCVDVIPDGRVVDVFGKQVI